MERDKALGKWEHENWDFLRSANPTEEKVHRAFQAGWEAAIDEFVCKTAPEERWGTLEGAERYLENQDRMSFLDLRRAKQASYNWETIDLLQDRWIAYGEAWGIIQRLLPKPEPIALH